MSARPGFVVVIVMFVVSAAALSAALPLFVYSTSLALFGFAHVAAEMRYVDARFGRRIARELVVGIAVLLVGVALIRALRITGVIGSTGTAIELGFVCALGALALPALARRGALQLAVGIAVVGSLALGTFAAPALTIVALAVLHNATPVGFLVDAAPPERRLRVAALSLLAFIGAPLVVASGVVRCVLAALGVLSDPATSFVNVSVLPTGPLRDHFLVYLPSSLHRWDGAVDAFAAVVCAQVLHYGAAIVLLPRLLRRGDVEDRPLLPWPRTRVLVVGIALLGAGLLAHFAWQFAEARALYGVAAAVHAWVEVPVLLLALAGVSAASSSTPGSTSRA